MDKKIENIILQLPEQKRLLALQIRDIFLTTDRKISEAIKWGNLTFMYKGNIAFVYTFKDTGYINLGFMRAVELSDPKKLFEGTGKGMRHIKVHSEKEIPKTQLKKWIREAMLLNESHAD